MQARMKFYSHIYPFIVRTLFVLCCLSALFTIACKSDYPAGARQEKGGGGQRGEARQVKVSRASELPMGEAVTVNGTLAAFDQASIGVKVPGRLQTIAVDLGSVVRKGQLIAQVEPQDYQLRVQQAEAALQQTRARLGLGPEDKTDRVNPQDTGTVKQARALLEEARVSAARASTLVQQGVIARAEYDTAKAALSVAESRYQDAIEEIRNREGLLAQRRSELALARQQLSDTSVYAPFDGVIEEKLASIGEYLAAGAPLVRLVKMNPLRFRAEIPEREAANIRSGQMLRLTVEGSPRAYAGQVMRLSPTIREQSRILVVEADISNDGLLRPGAFARADISVNDSSLAVAVPTSAIINFAGIEKVIIVDNGKALEKPVTTGRRAAEWTEILSGINVGDSVVLEPGNLQSGQAVNVVE